MFKFQPSNNNRRITVVGILPDPNIERSLPFVVKNVPENRLSHRSLLAIAA